MPFTVPAVPQDEPDAAVPAGAIGEAAEILAMARSGQLSMLTGQLEDSVTPEEK